MSTRVDEEEMESVEELEAMAIESPTGYLSPMRDSEATKDEKFDTVVSDEFQLIFLVIFVLGL